MWKEKESRGSINNLCFIFFLQVPKFVNSVWHFLNKSSVSAGVSRTQCWPSGWQHSSGKTNTWVRDASQARKDGKDAHVKVKKGKQARPRWRVESRLARPEHEFCYGSNCFQIGKGVPQGCILSPCLINLYAASWETLGWRKHKLESRLPGEISITSDMQMTPPLW